MNYSIDSTYNPTFEKKIDDWTLKHLGFEIMNPGFDRLKHYISFHKELFHSRGIKIVTIGGTNGKGETAYSLSHLLSESSINHAVWSSPHILTVRERMLCNGEMIGEKELWENIHFCHQEMERVGVVLSYYEFFLYVFVHFISKQDISHIIFEVGMGGDYDGVNFFDADLTSLVSIGRDHEDILGRGYRKILKTKLGITRANAPLITAFEQGYVRNLTERYLKDRDIEWIDLFTKDIITEEDSYSRRNQILAHALRNVLLGGLSLKKFDEKLREHLPKNHFPSFKGRNEKMTLGSISFIFIGAHNIDGIRKLQHFLERDLQNKEGQNSFDKMIFSFSKRDESEIRVMIRLMQRFFANLTNSIYVTGFKHFKAIDLDSMFSIVKACDGSCSKSIGLIENWKTFLDSEIKSNRRQNILITGSYYFIGSVQNYLLQK
jgi:dihydrofolate synthase/folylpolyglutamate synthase